MITSEQDELDLKQQQRQAFLELYPGPGPHIVRPKQSDPPDTQENSPGNP